VAERRPEKFVRTENSEMTFKQGDRVEFRSSRHDDEVRTGRIQAVRGKGNGAQFTITDDEDQQSVNVLSHQIQQKL
jgi:hypothetical protein